MSKPLCKLTLVLLISTLTKGQLPEDEFRIIKKFDLLAADSDTFSDQGVSSYTQLLFDVARDQIVVGARDTLYRVSLRGLRLLERADWPAPSEKTQLCQDKGQTEEDCHNYIKVLLSYSHKLFACGTNAYSPMCSWREIESIGKVHEWVNGIAHSPYNPKSNVTAVLSSTGEYYAGTPTDFSSSDTAICRSTGASHKYSNTLRTTQYDLNWLNEPQFVGSFEDENYVYFVFREIAVEFLNCGKTIYSRIGRVCKNDSGGQQLMKGSWSTFLKARLNCSVPGDFPFYYDEVQNIEYLGHENILVATFTTPINSIAGSAVCMYNMSDITSAFEGPYKVQDTPNSSWEPRSPSYQVRDHFRCTPNSLPHQSIEYHKYHLMHDAIQPISHKPIYKSLNRLNHITADITHTKGVKQFVLYISNEDGDVLKLAVLPQIKGACLVEVWKLRDEEEKLRINALQFVKDTMSLYIASDNGVSRLIAFHCDRYKSRTTCLSASDPHCGWDDAREICLDVASRLSDAYFIQEPHTCGASDDPVDGGWSSWSPWEECLKESSTRSAYGEEKDDMCQCRHRVCNNPAPKHGGKKCEGPKTSVSNCTVHGGWSSWSGWSPCSSSCGIAIKSRRRSCNAPSPQHGGRVCVGLEVQELYCSTQPPCPDPSLAPIEGGWSSWSGWSPCDSPCGKSQRKRSCNNPSPKRGGSTCHGSSIEYKPCDGKCDSRKANAYTPWVHTAESSDGSYSEKRFKFTCKASNPDQVKLAISKEEERFCTALGECTDSIEGGWSAWSVWSECSVPCGGGQQKRSRSCKDGTCQGHAEMLRACNQQACTDKWSCWSDWSECIGDCSSIGHRTRTRTCLSHEGCDDASAAVEKRVCYKHCDDDDSSTWGVWGDWSPCEDGQTVRRRDCEKGACIGPMAQVAYCDENDEDNELNALPAYSDSIEMASFVSTRHSDTMSLGGIIGCVITSFALGCLTGLVSLIYYTRKHDSRLPWSRSTRVPSSPHYMTAKQNSYVTVPLSDVPRKPKRQPSFSGIGNNIVTKANNLANNHNNTLTTPKLYPKAMANEYDTIGTLRRNGNLARNNLDYEEEKFY